MPLAFSADTTNAFASRPVVSKGAQMVINVSSNGSMKAPNDRSFVPPPPPPLTMPGGALSERNVKLVVTKEGNKGFWVWNPESFGWDIGKSGNWIGWVEGMVGDPWKQMSKSMPGVYIVPDGYWTDGVLTRKRKADTELSGDVKRRFVDQTRPCVNRMLYQLSLARVYLDAIGNKLPESCEAGYFVNSLSIVLNELDGCAQDVVAVMGGSDIVDTTTTQ